MLPVATTAACLCGGEKCCRNRLLTSITHLNVPIRRINIHLLEISDIFSPEIVKSIIVIISGIFWRHHVIFTRRTIHLDSDMIWTIHTIDWNRDMIGVGLDCNERHILQPIRRILE